jgi:hypothetical protein
MELKAKHKIMFGEDFDDPTFFKPETRKVSEFDENYVLITNSQDIKEIKELVAPFAEDYDGFFAIIEDGDYKEIWGFEGTVPFTWKTAYKVYWQ